jgi:hypothetical protein
MKVNIKMVFQVFSNLDDKAEILLFNKKHLPSFCLNDFEFEENQTGINNCITSYFNNVVGIESDASHWHIADIYIEKDKTLYMIYRFDGEYYDRFGVISAKDSYFSSDDEKLKNITPEYSFFVIPYLKEIENYDYSVLDCTEISEKEKKYLI